ncbi:hypothetical protein GOV05_01100 [Candidatus Woesearchaeota archaeon]|nr:hypothetical protein [Candidatus Woesearchaeota archaeon]
MSFDLELERVKKIILEQKPTRVLLQLPEGLRPQAKKIQDFLEKNTKATILLWAGTAYGACDVPELQAKKIGVDVIITWGHTEWR